MQHSNVSYPVIGVIYVDGYPVNLRRKGGGTLEEAGLALVRSMLPQNDTVFQEGNYGKPVVGMAGAECADGAASVGGVFRGRAGR